MLSKRKEDVDQIIAQRKNAQAWQILEHDYNKYRGNAVKEMVILRKKNITDLEIEQAKYFSVEVNRQIEYERQELNRLEAELQSLK